MASWWSFEKSTCNFEENWKKVRHFLLVKVLAQTEQFVTLNMRISNMNMNMVVWDLTIFCHFNLSVTEHFKWSINKQQRLKKIKCCGSTSSIGNIR